MVLTSAAPRDSLSLAGYGKLLFVESIITRVSFSSRSLSLSLSFFFSLQYALLATPVAIGNSLRDRRLSGS